MDAFTHDSCNRVLGAPLDWVGDSGCGSLAIRDDEIGNVPAVVSFWKPSHDELLALANGGCVALWVCGRTMAPVTVQVESIK